MLISRKSPRGRGKGPFHAHFLAGADDLPLRRYRLCREALTTGTLHAGILAALLVSMVLFARSAWLLFLRHGAAGNPWWPRAGLVALGVVVALMAWRLWRRIRELRELRAEVARLARELRGAPPPPPA